MANSKSVIRDINLKNININLNKNKSIISDFTGFNKNTGVWFNGVLSNLYCNDNKETDADVIVVGEDTYKIVGNELYKNDVLVKDYTNTDKVSTEILPNIKENVLAYTPQVYIYYEGSSAYIKSGDTVVQVGTYSTSYIPYIIVDKEDDTWCVLYGHNVICKGMTTAKFVSSIPTAALYLYKKWYYVNDSNLSLINVKDSNDTITIDKTANIIDGIFGGAVNVTGWTPTKFKAVQLDSRTIFAAIDDWSVSDKPTVTFKKSKTFMYLKGFWIANDLEDLLARPHYSIDGEAIDMSVVPNGRTILTQAYNAFSKLASIKTKFLSYNSYLVIPYGTFDGGTGGAVNAQTVTFSSIDGPCSYLLESCYTKSDDEFMTLTGSVLNGYPKLLGLFNNNYSPEWLSTDIANFKLIYNKDALVGISKNGSLVVPWNDVDENTLTIVGDDIYYYSLNSNAWMHVNVSKANKLKALKVGNNLLLNCTKDNCWNKDDVTTFSEDTSLANFKIYKPRVGLINFLNIQAGTFIVPGNSNNYKLGNKWLTNMLEDIKKTEPYYISIVGKPIWAATQLQSYNKTINVRKNDIWQYTLNPTYDTENINYEYYLKNMYTSGTFDAYTSLTGSVLSYFKSWYEGSARYNNKLADTEKSVTEPTYYNLSPNIDIMTFIDGFNTVALIKVGNNTLQLLVKESELMLVYNILSNVGNISDYFVLQGQQYGIINGYINKVDMVNGQVVAQTPITSVDGLKFLGNTDKQAFFFSQMNKTIQYFAADNTLEFLMDATELDNNVTTVFAKQTNDIFVLLNDKVVVFTDSGSMFELPSRAEYITFGDNSWSDGNKTWSYYKINNEQKRVPINIETVWYGDTATRRLMKVTCLYIELYDDNYMPGNFEISLDSLMNNTAFTKKQVFNVKSSDYDRITRTVYLRFQPSVQNCSAFKLNIKSDLAIKRLAVEYTPEDVILISKNNI